MENYQNEDDSWQFRTEEEAQLAEAVMQKAMAAIDSGQNPEQVLAAVNMPEAVKQKIRRRLREAMQQREAARSAPAPAAQAPAKRFGMAAIINLIPKPALDKIQAIFAKNPTLANQVKEQGAKLLMHGVTPDLDFKPGQSISAPTVGVGLGKGQNQQR